MRIWRRSAVRAGGYKCSRIRSRKRKGSNRDPCPAEAIGGLVRENPAEGLEPAGKPTRSCGASKGRRIVEDGPNRDGVSSSAEAQIPARLRPVRQASLEKRRKSTRTRSRRPPDPGRRRHQCARHGPFRAVRPQTLEGRASGSQARPRSTGRPITFAHGVRMRAIWPSGSLSPEGRPR